MKTAIELTKDTAGSYFESVVAPRLNAPNARVVSAEEIDEYTNSCFIFRLHLEGGSDKIVYLKQARAKTKKKDFFIPPHRIIWETESISRFNAAVGEFIAPRVIYLDKDNFILVMEDVLSGGEMLIDAYKNGELRADLGKKFGSVLGRLHGKTFWLKNDFFNDPDWQKVLTEDVFYQHFMIGTEKILGKKTVDLIMSDSRKVPHAFCHMDLLIKNIIVHPNTFRIIDFEQATVWDPAYDIGALLTPWAIALATVNGKANASAKLFISSCISAYKTELSRNNIPKEIINNLMRRALRFTATTMLHHTCGADVFDFLEPIREEVKESATSILEGKQNVFSRLMNTLYGAEPSHLGK